MAASAEHVTSDLFKQAVESFDATLRTGVRFQEEVAKWWQDSLAKTPIGKELQKKAAVVLEEAIPVARQNCQEYHKVIEQNSRNCIELLNKAFEAGPPTSVSEAQEKAKELWQASLDTLRRNTEAALEANAKALERWAVLAGKGSNGQPETSE